MDGRKLLCGTIYVRLCAPIDLYARAREVAHTGSFFVFSVLNFQRCLFRFFLPSRAVPIIIVIIYSPQFFEMRNKHTYTQATRAINMKYCLIEDIVLKTLPRAFFPRFYFFYFFIIRYLFIIFHPSRSSGSLIVYTLSRRTLLGTKKKKNNNNKRK